MVDAWPNELPQYVLVDGYSESVGDGTVEYPPDIGPPITRLRTNSVVRPLSISLELSKAKLKILRDFHDVTLSLGSLPFSMSAPSEDETYLVKFAKGGGPKWTGIGGRYFRVSMSLLVLP